MRIVCPACEATYDVPDRLIGTGRSLRCRKCAHEWLVQPPEASRTGGAVPPAPAPLADPRLADPAMSHPPLAPPAMLADPSLPQDFDSWPVPMPPAATSPPLSLRAAWAASILLVTGFALALWVFRAEVTQAWPPAARLYQLLGATAGG